MSDFLYTSKRQPQGKLTRSLMTIYLYGEPTCFEYHGPWGSLAVSKSRYKGFDHFETDRHICVIIGAPVLNFCDNSFLVGCDQHYGAQAIFNRWQGGMINWENDLSGPFAVLIIEKQSAVITFVTDLMMFIPVYRHFAGSVFSMGTHVDAVAEIAGQKECFDETSLTDFVLHDVVTYPYTAFKDVFQCNPAAIHHVHVQTATGTAQFDAAFTYWIPAEREAFASLYEAAAILRAGISEHICRITTAMDCVAHFISAGEDSRTIAGILPSHLKRDAFIFLDSMNKEGQIAKRAAAAYGSNFMPDFRSPIHYLDVLQEASALVGSGHQYQHAHSLVFDRRNNLSEYTAVFGGYLADSLLKGEYTAKHKRARNLPFLSDSPVSGERRTEEVTNPLFPSDVLEEITQRRIRHLHRVKSIRPSSAHEWFVLWPMTMRSGLPNLFCNRRLFASYEPFMSSEAVKVASAVPIEWKLNRRLFNAAFRPYLAKSRFIRHPDGHFPYYPWWINRTVLAAAWTQKRIRNKFSKNTSIHSFQNQGPWGSWRTIKATPYWSSAVANADLPGAELPVLSAAIHKAALTGNDLNTNQKVNLLQTCFLVQRSLS